MTNNGTGQKDTGKQQKYNANQYNKEDLLEGLDDISIPMSKKGNIYTIRLKELQQSLELCFVSTYGIDETDHVVILLKYDRNDDLVNALARVYFNTKGVTNGNIVRKGFGVANGGTAGTILQFVPGATFGGDGDFTTSDLFKEVFAPLAVSRGDEALYVGSIPNNDYIACVDLDFKAVSAFALNISETSPYNFSLLSAKPLGGGDHLLLFGKYIDTTSGIRGRHRRKNNVNYAALDREFAKQNDIYYGNGGNKRQF